MAQSQAPGPYFNPRYDNNRFGGNFGGPILKNKLFFFTNWEYNPIGQVANSADVLRADRGGLRAR